MPPLPAAAARAGNRARLLEASRSFHAAASEPALLADLTARLREVAGAPVPIFPPAAHEGGVRLEAGPVPAEARPVADLMLELAAGALSRIRAAEQRVELRTLERTAEFRQTVLSSVSHDLRTPLATILTSASTLRAFGDTLPEETVARAYADIEGEVLRMNRFIVGLLDMIRVDGGGLELDLHALDVLELLDRLRAAQRGLERRFNQQTTFVAGPLKVSFAERRVWVMGEEMRMTPREFELLRILARHAGRPVTHRQIRTAIWGGEGEIDAQTVRVLVAQLRLKVEENPSSPRLVLTEPGVGYRLVTAPAGPG